MGKVFEHFDVETIRQLNRWKLLWFQAVDTTFYLTHTGLRLLRESGRIRKRLPQLNWKHNPHEMTADMAIAMFAGPLRSPLLTEEGILVNEPSPRNAKPRYKQLAPIIVRKKKHLPSK